MSLSNTVVTKLIDPRSHNDQRTEFRLEDDYYAADMRLVDLGVYDTALLGTDGMYYPTLNGVLQCAKGIYLYSGTTLIDSIQNTAQYTAIEAIKVTNQASEDINRSTIFNGMGFSEVILDDVGVKPGSITLSGLQDFHNDINSVQAINNQVPIANRAFGRQSGSAYLSDYLQFFKSIPVIAKYGTSLLPALPDLRLVIEWDINPASYFRDPNNSSGALNPQVIRPTLIVDKLLGVDPSDFASGYTMPYLSTIVERLPVPVAVTPGNDTNPQRASFKSQAFVQKFLKDLTFFNLSNTDLPSASDRWLTKATRSPAMKGEVIQLVVNNETWLPDQGIYTPALKYHYFNDTFTGLNLPLAAGMYNLVDPSNYAFAPDTKALVGEFSVTACKIGTVINNLQVEYQRLYSAETDSQHEQFTLLLFGTVAKNLTVQGRNVRVSY